MFILDPRKIGAVYLDHTAVEPRASSPSVTRSTSVLNHHTTLPLQDCLRTDVSCPPPCLPRWERIIQVSGGLSLRGLRSGWDHGVHLSAKAAQSHSDTGSSSLQGAECSAQTARAAVEVTPNGGDDVSKPSKVKVWLPSPSVAKSRPDC